VFGDEAADVEGDKKESKKEAKGKEGEESTEQPKKKRKHKKDEEYGVSRGKQACRSLQSATNSFQASTSRTSPRWSTSICRHQLPPTHTG
jgi:hypothetical protein